MTDGRRGATTAADDADPDDPDPDYPDPARADEDGQLPHHAASSPPPG